MHVESVPDEIHMRGGSLYLDAALCARYFDGIQAVALLCDEDGGYLIPLTMVGTGGYLLKIRNARGDRVVHCPEFIELLGCPQEIESVLEVRWDAERYALSIPLGRERR